MIEKTFNGEEITRLVNVIEENSSFLIIGHIDPDGDCIGSMLAMALFLRAKGKKVLCYAPGESGKDFSSLPGFDMFADENEITSFSPSVVFSLDAPTIARTSDVIAYEDHRIVINIDHHPSNEFYGDINIVDPEASATAVLVYRIMSEIQPESITRDIADCLYVGILLDTGGFKFQNTDAEVFRTASALVERGARAFELAREFLYVKKLSTLKLLARALDSLEVHAGGKIAFMTITSDMIVENGSSMSETEGFVDYAASVDEVVLSALFREISLNETRVSLRSRDDYDVALFASRFGGGGHRNAAGLTIYKGIEEAKRIILEGLEEVLHSRS